MKRVGREGKKRTCLGKFLERSATLTLTVIVSYKILLSRPSFYNHRLLSLQLYWELWSLSEVQRHIETRTEPTNCSTDHTCNANTACHWSTSKTGGSVSTFIIAIVLWCAAARPYLWAPRYHCSTAHWVMGIANHWQREFHSQPYTRRQVWRSARIYSLPLSPAGCPRSFLSSYPKSTSQGVSHFTSGRRQDK